MVQEPPRRTGFGGPKLIRLLARLTDADVPASPLSPPDKLGGWLAWTDAIALSGALSGAPVAAMTALPAAYSTEEREFARVKTALENAITGKSAASARAQAGPRGQRRAPAQPDIQAAELVQYATHRQRYSTLQQTMETNIGGLRRRLRGVLAAASPALNRLAVVDAAMEQALSARERTLLAGIPGLLEPHFDRVRRAGQVAADPAADGGPAAGAPEARGADATESDATGSDLKKAVDKPMFTVGPWLDVFRQDMQSVLLAELEIRLEPIEALLEALRGG
jgi:hypothetical protein